MNWRSTSILSALLVATFPIGVLHLSAQPETPHAQPAVATAAWVSPYLALQKALAADDLAKAQAAAHHLSTALAGQATPEIRQALDTLAQAKDLKTARVPFKAVSDGVIALAKAQAPEGTSLYLAHCPMAFGNRGASWLQAGTTIDNPYFGAMMRRCGVIQETLSGTASAPDHAHHHEH